MEEEANPPLRFTPGPAGMTIEGSVWGSHGQARVQSAPSGSTASALIPLLQLKRLATRLPSGHPLREVLSYEPDLLTRSEYLTKVQAWTRLLWWRVG